MIKEVSSIWGDVTHDLWAAQEAASKTMTSPKPATASSTLDNHFNRKTSQGNAMAVILTTTTAHTQKMNIEGGMHAVNNANFSKFDQCKPCLTLMVKWSATEL
jgi:hypothetical protein